VRVHIGTVAAAEPGKKAFPRLAKAVGTWSS
jgi:hypothetical protein